MYIIKCEICGEIFKSDILGKEKQKLTKHIKNCHVDITMSEYVEKYYYNGERPRCACGCGNFTKYNKYKFDKYFLNHKDKMPVKRDTILKCLETKNKGCLSIEYRLKQLGYTVGDLKKMYDSFLNREKDLSDLEREFALDNRTIKKYWKELNIIENLTEFERICKLNKVNLKKNSDGHKIKIDKEILLDIFLFLEEHKNKHTLQEIINKFELDFSTLILFNRLVDEYGEDIIKSYLKSGNSSKIELEFYNILKFYFKKDVNKQFRLENKIYDFILLDKILIEFDGDYWHSLEKAIKNDKLKDDIALKNGYILIRVSENECRNPKILLNIIDVYNKIKNKI